MNPSKSIYLLIGPKGSGKSYIGSLLQQHFHIPFIRVEDWAKKIKRGRAVNNDAYLQEVFEAIEAGIRKELESVNRLCFESTGLTAWFDQMLARLKTDFMVVTIGLRAEPELCLQRVRTRDQSVHIDVSDEQVTHINQLVRQKNTPTDFELENNNKPTEALVAELEHIVQHHHRG